MTTKWTSPLHVLILLLVTSGLARFSFDPELAFAVEAPVVHGSTGPSPVQTTQALLDAFAEREGQLDQRQAALEDQWTQLQQAKNELAEQLQDLKDAEQELAATIAAAEDAASDDLARLTAVFENMKPQDSAALFTEMPPAFGAGFLAMMRAESAAAIMSELAPDKAFSFAAVLAGRNAEVLSR